MDFYEYWSELNHLDDSYLCHPLQVDGLPKLTEANLNRVIKGHDKNGYVIVSASREENRHEPLPDTNDVRNNPLKRNPDELNNIRTRQLQRQLALSNYSWIPVMGEYTEQGSNVPSVEKSFMVYPIKQTGEEVDFDTFLNDIEDIMKTPDSNSENGPLYNQDSILVKRPNEDYVYIPLKDSVDAFSPGNKIVTNDTDQPYFTAIKKWKDMSLNRKGRDFKNSSPQRFTLTKDQNSQKYTYTEMYLCSQPGTIMEAHRRSSMGELVVYGFYE